MSHCGFVRNKLGMVVEFFPQVDLANIYEKRALVLELLNAYLPKNSKICTKKANLNQNIFEILNALPNGVQKDDVFDLLEISSEKIELNLDVNKSFTKLVYKRMLPLNSDKTIICHLDKIEVKDSGNKSLTIYPQWKQVSKNELFALDSEIKKASDTLSNICSCVYLVFPKNKDFTKHIQVLHTGLKMSENIKIIPYSFSFCTRSCKKNCVI